MNTDRFCKSLLIIFFCLAVSPISHSQNQEVKEVSRVQSSKFNGDMRQAQLNLDRIDEALPSIEWRLHIAVSITVIIAFLGIAIAAVERASGSPQDDNIGTGKGRAGVTIVVLGLLVSVIEVLKTFVFPYDHETISQKRPKIIQALSQAKDAITVIKEEYRVTKNNTKEIDPALFELAKQKLTNEVQPNIEDALEHIEELGVANYTNATVNAGHNVKTSTLFSAAYAQQNDNSSLHNIKASGTGPSIDQAKVNLFEALNENASKETEKVYTEFFKDPYSFQSCVGLTEDFSSENVARELVSYYYFERIDDLSFDETTQMYTVSSSVNFPKSLDELTKEVLFSELADSDIPPKCLDSLDGLYYGEWISNKYVAAGNMMVSLRGSQNNLSVDIKKMTGSKYVLSDLTGTFTTTEQVTTTNLSGYRTKVTGILDNGSVNADYNFRFGFLGLFSDTGEIKLKKVSDIPDEE